MSSQGPIKHKSKSNAGIFLFVGLLILVMISALGQCGSGNDDDASKVETADPQEQAAIDAVQDLDTVLASNMHESIGVVLVILENQGHTQRIDGWYVSRANDYYAVKFYFYLDGNRQFAEWWYSPGTKAIDPMNDWAYVFMGQ